MNISVGLAALLESQYLSGVQNMHFVFPPIRLLLIRLCALNYCLAMLCYVLMKHDAPSTVLQTRVLRQYLFFLSKIVLSIFLRIFLPSDYFLVSSKNIQLFSANCSGAAIFFFLCLLSFSFVLFHFFSLKWMHEQIVQKLLKICNCFAITLGLFFLTCFQDCMFGSWCYLCRTSTPGESSNSSNSFQFVNSIALLWTDEHPDLKKYLCNHCQLGESLQYFL